MEVHKGNLAALIIAETLALCTGVCKAVSVAAERLSPLRLFENADSNMQPYVNVGLPFSIH
jgi:hypothetical protein